MVPGMHAVGERFTKGRMFVTDIMASAEAMRTAMVVLDPDLKKLRGQWLVASSVVLGTTKGDIHQVGKSLVGTLLATHGISGVRLRRGCVKGAEAGASRWGVLRLYLFRECGQVSFRMTGSLLHFAARRCLAGVHFSAQLSGIFLLPESNRETIACLFLARNSNFFCTVRP